MICSCIYTTMGILDGQWANILIIVATLLLFVIWKRLKRGSSEMVKEKLNNGATVVDVRSIGEFQGGHFPGALNIPLETLMNQVTKLGSKEKSLILYCASGARSGVAKTMLNRAGFMDVINAGGLFHIMEHK